MPEGVYPTRGSRRHTVDAYIFKYEIDAAIQTSKEKVPA